MIQTALVLSSQDEMQYEFNLNQWSMHPGLSADHLRHDGRLRPAYYITSVGLLSLLTLVCVVPYMDKLKAANMMGVAFSNKGVLSS